MFLCSLQKKTECFYVKLRDDLNGPNEYFKMKQFKFHLLSFIGHTGQEANV